MSGTLTQTDLLSPAPILDAVEHYRGTIVDLDASRSLSGDEFARARETLTNSLRRYGLMSGERVVVAVANGPLFIATLTAILACEGSPLVVHAKTPAGEVLRYAQRFGCRYLACEPREEPGLTAIAASTVEIDFAHMATLCWATLDVPPQAFCGPSLAGVPLHPTSGSTGLPKIALRPGFAAMEEARHYVETMAIGPADTIVAIPPMSHAYGYGMCVMVPLVVGSQYRQHAAFQRQIDPSGHQRISGHDLAHGAGHAGYVFLRQRLGPEPTALGAHRRSRAAAA